MYDNLAVDRSFDGTQLFIALHYLQLAVSSQARRRTSRILRPVHGFALPESKLCILRVVSNRWKSFSAPGFRKKVCAWYIFTLIKEANGF